jgi:alkanesulfonate monooxygenase SsuD/methylene tetrahydromethanopterin reductase-like flavin-dependent oxidoreductase (luciferase family)
MKYDIFFSISQTPVDGHTPSEAVMFRNAMEQLQAADRQGYGVAWFAESHLSSEVQKGNARPVIPHWKGEVGLNTDFLALAAHAFARTERIELGSAVMNIVCMGGPIAHAERIAAFLSLHGLDPDETRRIHVGFAAGRFQFMNEASGIVPRDPVEEVAWPALRGLVFREAADLFLKLLRGDTLSAEDVRATSLTRANFRTAEHWAQVQAAWTELYGEPAPELIEVPHRWDFESLKIVPQDWRRELLQLVIGSHEPVVQEEVNQLLPVQVFNLSITRADIIEATHERMRRAYHPDGGAWERGHMPRTTFVFLNEEEGLSVDEKRAAADREARAALSEYWKALQGTIDPARIDAAADNALIGDATQVADQIRQRFHPDDRLMLWFDFFNHDCERVIRNQQAFMDKVAPLLEDPA